MVYNSGSNSPDRWCAFKTNGSNSATKIGHNLLVKWVAYVHSTYIKLDCFSLVSCTKIEPTQNTRKYVISYELYVFTY